MSKLTLDVQAFSVEAKGEVHWSSKPVNVLISFSGETFDDILFEIDNIPESKEVARIYEAVTGASAPKILSEVVITGVGKIAVSTYNTGNIKEGFNFIVDATIATVCLRAINISVTNNASTRRTKLIREA